MLRCADQCDCSTLWVREAGRQAGSIARTKSVTASGLLLYSSGLQYGSRASSVCLAIVLMTEWPFQQATGSRGYDTRIVSATPTRNTQADSAPAATPLRAGMRRGPAAASAKSPATISGNPTDASPRMPAGK